MASDEEKVRPAFERTVWEWQFSVPDAAHELRGPSTSLTLTYRPPTKAMSKGTIRAAC